MSAARKKPFTPSRNAQAYAAMLDASARLGLPTSFQTDLTKHDRETLLISGFIGEGDAFVWVLRESGTHVIKAITSPKGLGSTCKPRREEKGVSCVSIRNTFDGQAIHWFFWDGLALIECRSAEEADERLERWEHQHNPPEIVLFARERWEFEGDVGIEWVIRHRPDLSDVDRWVEEVDHPALNILGSADRLRYLARNGWL
jgi:hypothetical protein